MPQTSSMTSRTSTKQTATRRSVRVIMLDKQELFIKIENKGARVSEVFAQVCQHIDLRETDYFGLAIFQDSEFQFILSDTKLQKLAPKVWKSKDCSVDEPLLTFHFRVQYYIDNIGLLKEKATRLQYYLQLRDNLLHYNQSVSEEKCFLLAGLALQADFGNFDQQRHVGAYFDPREFFPAWVMIRRGQDYITHHLPTVHRDMAGMSPPDARVQYIRDSSEPPATHNMHFYRLRRRKYDPAPGNDWLAICPKGLEVYEESSDNFKNLLSVFLWSDIGKLSCEKKKFEIVADGLAERRFIYYASSKESGERLLDMCRASHRFQLSRQAQLSELKRLEEHDRWGVRQHEKYIYSENVNFSSQAAVTLPPAGGGSGRITASGAARRSENVIRALSSPPSASTPVTGSEETRLKEIMIDSPPQITPSSLSLTRVTPITGQSTVWTSPPYDVSSGIESLLQRLPQQQPSFIPSPYPSTPAQPSLLHMPAVSRGSFTRSSGMSSTEGSMIETSGGNVGRFPPQPILKQLPPTVSQPRPDVSLVNTTLPTVSSISTPGSTSINAKSLHLPPGADLNDVISQMFNKLMPSQRQPVAPTVHQNAVTPIRKSSLVSPRSGPTSSTDVIRSTSLRQPSTKSEWPPLRHGFISTELNLSAMPSPVDAVFQHISFASPMTVTSNPVYSASGAAAASSAQMTPPTYHPPPTYNTATNIEQLTFSNTPQLQPQRSNQFPGTAMGGRPQHDLLLPPLLGVHQSQSIGGERRPYFDALVPPESSANSSLQLEPPAPNTTYHHFAPTPRTNTAELRPAQPYHSQTAITAVGKLVGPPSYQEAKSLKMNALSMTPPGTNRYFEDIELSQQPRFPVHLSDQTNGVPPPTAVSLTNGDANRTYVAAPVLVANGQLEPAVVNGPMMHLSTPQTRPVGMAVSQAASAPVNRQVHQPMRQLSSDSADQASVPCLQHGSNVNIVDLIRDDVGAPLLKALCNDPSLRSSCTCNQPQQPLGIHTVSIDCTPPTPASATTRRLSLCQPLSVWEASCDHGRPYSWASEYGSAGQLSNLQTTEINSDGDVNGLTIGSPRELVNGTGNFVHSGLPHVHRNSDSAVCLTHAEQIMANY